MSQLGRYCSRYLDVSRELKFAGGIKRDQRREQYINLKRIKNIFSFKQMLNKKKSIMNRLLLIVGLVAIAHGNDNAIHQQELEETNNSLVQQYLFVLAHFIPSVPNFGRIINGDLVAEGEIPYQVSLQDFETSFHFCGGSVISKKTILTTAHCVLQ